MPLIQSHKHWWMSSGAIGLFGRCSASFLLRDTDITVNIILESSDKKILIDAKIGGDSFGYVLDDGNDFVRAFRYNVVNPIILQSYKGTSWYRMLTPDVRLQEADKVINAARAKIDNIE